jgi:hypothetical protein
VELEIAIAIEQKCQSMILKPSIEQGLIGEEQQSLGK